MACRKEAVMKAFMRATSLLSGMIVFLIVNTAWADLTIGNYTLVGSKRVGRVEYEYTYQAQVTNDGEAVKNVTAQLTINSAYTTVIEGHLEFDDVAAGATADSVDTFIVKHDRTYPFDWSALVWEIQSESTAPTVSLSADPQTVKFGESTTLSWQATNAETLSIEPGIGEVGLNASISVTVYAKTTYIITATGLGKTATDSVEVDVTDIPPPGIYYKYDELGRMKRIIRIPASQNP